MGGGVLRSLGLVSTIKSGGILGLVEPFAWVAGFHSQRVDTHRPQKEAPVLHVSPPCTPPFPSTSAPGGLKSLSVFFIDTC